MGSGYTCSPTFTLRLLKTGSNYCNLSRVVEQKTVEFSRKRLANFRDEGVDFDETGIEIIVPRIAVQRSWLELVNMALALF